MIDQDDVTSSAAAVPLGRFPRGTDVSHDYDFPTRNITSSAENASPIYSVPNKTKTLKAQPTENVSSLANAVETVQPIYSTPTKPALAVKPVVIPAQVDPANLEGSSTIYAEIARTTKEPDYDEPLAPVIYAQLDFSDANISWK